MKIDEWSIHETLMSTTLTIDDSFHRKYTKVSGKILMNRSPVVKIHRTFSPTKFCATWYIVAVFGLYLKEAIVLICKSGHIWICTLYII